MDRKKVSVQLVDEDEFNKTLEENGWGDLFGDFVTEKADENGNFEFDGLVTYDSKKGFSKNEKSKKSKEDKSKEDDNVR